MIYKLYMKLYRYRYIYIAGVFVKDDRQGFRVEFFIIHFMFKNEM